MYMNRYLRETLKEIHTSRYLSRDVKRIQWMCCKDSEWNSVGMSKDRTRLKSNFVFEIFIYLAK